MFTVETSNGQYAKFFSLQDAKRFAENLRELTGRNYDIYKHEMVWTTSLLEEAYP
jgi:hypothetical protein